MTAHAHATTNQEVQGILVCLFGPETKVIPAPSRPDWSWPHAIASYVDDVGAPRGWIACDLACANSCGAALSMIPPRLAAESAAAGTIPDNISDNLHEVLNVCVNLFHLEGHPHVVLGGVEIELSLDELPAGARPDGWLSWRVEIPKYPAGLMHIQTSPPPGLA